MERHCVLVGIHLSRFQWRLPSDRDKDREHTDLTDATIYPLTSRSVARVVVGPLQQPATGQILHPGIRAMGRMWFIAGARPLDTTVGKS